MLEAGSRLLARFTKLPLPPFPSTFVSQKTSPGSASNFPGGNDKGRAATNVSGNVPPLAGVWREVQGSDNWNNMLTPMHPVLRSEMVRYGELVKACYEALEFEPRSRHYGRCKYGRKRLLGEVGMADCGYEVTRYIYATPDISQLPRPLKQEGNNCNWIGFVAVAQREDEVRRLGRRDICVALRGTVTPAEWVANFVDVLTPARLDPETPRGDVKVELGFLSLYTSDDTFSNVGSAREQLLCEIGRLVRKYEGEDLSITITGHSMGAALALLCAYDVAEVGVNRRNYVNDRFAVPTTVFSFGGPRVGNAAFKERCDELGVRILRLVNAGDVVTNMPGVIFNEKCHFLERYSHVGVELALDRHRSPDLLASKLAQLCPSRVHQLETYLERLECNTCNCNEATSTQEGDRFSLIGEALRLIGRLRKNNPIFNPEQSVALIFGRQRSIVRKMTDGTYIKLALQLQLNK